MNCKYCGAIMLHSHAIDDGDFLCSNCDHYEGVVCECRGCTGEADFSLPDCSVDVCEVCLQPVAPGNDMCPSCSGIDNDETAIRNNSQGPGDCS